ncbi:armadillo-type protein [Choanephora cucurbitarum]|nr:armadillo-type protein [Choanephora cucurbitarum]
MVSQDKQADSTGPTPSSTSSSIASNTNHTNAKEHVNTVNQADKNSPEFYIDKFLEPDMRGVTPRLVAHLAVSLRTMPLSWVRQFIELKGLQIITNIIGALNMRDEKYVQEADLQMEVEILKCFKSLINNRWGAREVISHPQCIYHIVLSLVSPPIQTRKLVCEILAFVCHVDLPKGQEIVLRGLDKLSEHLGELGRFDAWLKLLDATLDGRVKRFAGGGAPDSHLADFALSNMMLVNSLVTVIEDVELRVQLRNQMNASGLENITQKMLDFNNEQLKRHISIYQQMNDSDVDEIMEIYNETIVTNMNDPRSCFERILERVEGTRSYNFFLSSLQHMLMIQAQGDTQVRYFQILDKLITQIVMDRKGLRSEDMSGNAGWSVGALIDKFAEQDQLNIALQEAKEAKQLYEKTIKEKQELETEINLKGDGLIGVLRDKANSLEDLLRMSRKTISTLQRKLKDTQQEYEMNIAALDQQLKEIHATAGDHPGALPSINSTTLTIAEKTTLDKSSEKRGMNLDKTELDTKDVDVALLELSTKSSSFESNLSTQDAFTEGNQAIDVVALVPTGQSRKHIRHQPNVKTRALQWTKIQANYVGTTVWNSQEVDEDALEDELDTMGIFSSIETLFAQKVIERKRLPQKKKKQEICILDPKKAYNINIAINLLNNMQANAPTADEQGKLSVFVKSASEEDLENLSKPDAFCVEMMKISRFKERIDLMLFRNTFDEKHQQLSKSMNSVLKASVALMESTSFKELLKFILVMGNFMNGSTFQGGAFGIRIASINKLVDTKGTEGNTTLLHFLVDAVESKFPRLHGFIEDLQESGDACKELENHYPEDEEEPEGDNFAQVMRNFRNEAIEKFEELEVRYTSMDIAYKDVVTYYGENPDQIKPDEFFGIFKTFTSSWEVSR